MSSRLSLVSIHLALLLTACPDPVAGPGDGSTSSSGDASSSSSGSSTEVEGPTTTDGSTTVVATTGSTTDEPDTGDPTTGGVIPVPEVCEDPPVPACDVPIVKCKEDQDGDGVPWDCENAPDLPNPDQADLDGDGFGDVMDLCPTIVGDNNNADTDKDGIGNACDTCPRAPSQYNKDANAVPFYMRVRGVPLQDDSDGDGVGDACDNCVRAPNCLAYGDGPGLTPFAVGMALDPMDPGCQPDGDLDFIGDACAGMQLPGAAGPVGFGDADDFDQDGVPNAGDGCPRQPVRPRSCETDEDCPEAADCAPTGVCNHPDRDADGVGDACDTCPDAANPQQVTEAGAMTDDIDRDFIGAACERNAGCVERANPRPFAFYDISVEGRCCTTVYDGAVLKDPDGNELNVEALGPRAAGVFELPPGCEQALKASEDGKAHRIESCNVDDPAQLYDYLCFLPALDNEYDDVPNECDLCEFAFDPSNAFYVDGDGKEWPNYGKYCHGDYDIENYEPADMCMPKP